MAKENPGRFDLLGDPIPEGWGKRGRPPHIPTMRNRNKIRVLLALGWSKRWIASAIGITKATLQKHYFVELRQRDEARPGVGGANDHSPPRLDRWASRFLHGLN